MDGADEGWGGWGGAEGGGSGDAGEGSAEGGHGGVDERIVRVRGMYRGQVCMVGLRFEV